jgi:hypothetical protein
MRVFCWVLRDILNSLSLLRAPGTCCGAVNDLMLLGKRDWDGFAYILLMGDIIAYIIKLYHQWDFRTKKAELMTHFN